jgi:phosphatidylglycerophosphatase C
MNIAIYDLDKTITRRPTFTRFLLFYARHKNPLRLLALPIWVLALVGYRLGFYPRKPLKQFGILLFMGAKMPADVLNVMAAKFADDIVANDLQHGAITSLESDRAAGHKLVLATAAPGFYAEHIGTRLKFDAVVATKHISLPDGAVSYRIDGENCYGAEKLKVVEAWFSEAKIERGGVRVRFYSDHHSDAPLFDWVDEAVLIAANPGAKLRALAKANDWQIVDFS